MSRFRTVALGALLVAASAGAASAQTSQVIPRPDSAKAGDWRKGPDRPHRGAMGHGDRRGIERGMRGRQGPMGSRGKAMGPGGRRGRGMAPGRPGRPGGPGQPGMELMRSLNLNETQRTQVRAIHEKYQPQMKTIHERARTEFEATREARQRGDTAAVKAALQRSRQGIESQASTLHEQMFRDVRAVLTAEQRAKVDAQLAERIQRLDQDKARLERLRR